MRDHLLFLSNIVQDWAALSSGGLGAVFALLGALLNQRWAKPLFWGFSLLCFLVASDKAWQDEHHNVAALVTEKAVALSSLWTCKESEQEKLAYSRGLERSVSDQRITLDRLHGDFEHQQGAINNCVVSLGKANPIISQRSFAFYHTILTDTVTSKNRFIPNKTSYVGTIIMTTNTAMKPSGVLTCNTPFTPKSAPYLPIEQTSYSLVASQLPEKISDRSYRISIKAPSLEWGPNYPMQMTVESDTENIFGCSFQVER